LLSETFVQAVEFIVALLMNISQQRKNENRREVTVKVPFCPDHARASAISDELEGSLKEAGPASRISC
jgi:hypothetical protein